MADRKAEHDRPLVTAWALSMAVHALVSLAGVMAIENAAVSRSGPAAPSPLQARLEIDVELELPPASPRALDLARGPDAEARTLSLPHSGGEGVARPDTRLAGRGGDPTSEAPAINLAPRDDRAHLTPMLRSRVDRAQEARLRNAATRSSPEDDSVNERPMTLTFFADGEGARREQRPYARHDPSGGTWLAGISQRQGFGAGLAPRRLPGDELRNRLPGDGRHGNAALTMPVGAGVGDRAAGYDSRSSADVFDARPMALTGRRASRATHRGLLRDDVDAEQEDISRERSLLHASTAGGPAGLGRGGQSGGHHIGSGGVAGPGSRSRAFGDGRGRGRGIDPADARRRSFLRNMWLKIHSSWSASAFPKRAALLGQQGYTIVAYTVFADGSVHSVRTVRPSGFPSFDAKMRAAVRRAAPFGRLPADFGGRLHHRHEFVVKNPVVR